MRIALIQDYLRVGGTETQALLMGKLWQQDGHEVHGIFFRRGGPLDDLPADAGITARWLQPCRTPLNWWAPGLAATLQQLAPDCVILFGRNAHTAMGRIAKSETLPGIVATMRTGRPLPGRYISVLQRAESVIANSGYGQRRALESGTPADRTLIIHNACRLDGSSIPNRAEARRSIGIDQNATLLICLSSFVPGKNHYGLLQALEPLLQQRAVQLWLVGDGPERSRISKIVQQRGWSSCVHLTGNRRDVPALLSAADLSVLASREESLPNVLVESAWCGLPAVAYEVAGVREVIQSGQTGHVIPPNDTKAFLAAVQNYLTNPAMRTAHGAAARKAATGKFSATQVARRYLEVFSKLQPCPFAS